jgi:uncharacterized membrane protein
MVAIASVAIIVLISLILTRVATVALIQTGLSKETARRFVHASTRTDPPA